jgi:pimeloyl-ACP methyl ester carboxylesterase
LITQLHIKMSIAMRERLIEINGCQLNLAESATGGPPLLLLHGVTRCWQDFDSLLPALSARYQLYGLDFRGHGGSQWSHHNYRVVDYVEDVCQVISQVIARPAIIYGHSLGAMVAAAVAARSPALVRALVLEDPPFETMGQAMAPTPFADFFRGLLQVVRQLRSDDAHRSDAVTDDEIRQTSRAIASITVGATGKPRVRLGDVRDMTALRFSAKCLHALDPEVLEAIVDGNWLESYAATVNFASVVCPTLVLQGDVANGGTLTEEDAQAMESSMADCTRVFFPGAGHQLHWTHTEPLLRHTLSFLSSLGISAT